MDVSTLSKNFLQVDTTNVLFVCGGAFAGLENIISQRLESSSMGFGAEISSKKEKNITDLLRK